MLFWAHLSSFKLISAHASLAKTLFRLNRLRLINLKALQEELWSPLSYSISNIIFTLFFKCSLISFTPKTDWQFKLTGILKMIVHGNVYAIEEISVENLACNLSYLHWIVPLCTLCTWWNCKRQNKWKTLLKQGKCQMSNRYKRLQAKEDASSKLSVEIVKKWVEYYQKQSPVGVL